MPAPPCDHFIHVKPQSEGNRECRIYLGTDPVAVHTATDFVTRRQARAYADLWTASHRIYSSTRWTKSLLPSQPTLH